jgi:hypothetical protein
MEASQIPRLRWTHWLVVFLAPLWASMLVEVLRRVNFLELNRYGGWQFNEVICTDEVLSQLPSQPLYVEYLDWPTLDAWTAATVAFLVTGIGLLLTINRMQTGVRKGWLIFLWIIVAGVSVLFSQGMLMSPKGTQIPFLVFTLFSLILVVIAFYTMSRLGTLSNELLTQAIAPVLGAYCLGICISIGWWLLLFTTNQLPYVARCQIY